MRGLGAVCLLLVVALSGCGKREVPWTQFSDAQGGFAVSMPGTPTKTPNSVQAASVTFSGMEYKLPAEDNRVSGFYKVMYIQFPPTAVLAELEPIIVEAYGDAGPGAFVYKRFGQFAGHPSINYHWRDTRGLVDYKGTIFLAKGRMYQVIAALPPAHLTLGYDTKFLDSFRWVS